MAGTADRVDVWLMLEYRPVWRSKACQDNDLAPEISNWLNAQMGVLSMKGFRVRLQLIRQHTDRTDTRIMLAHNGEMREVSSEGYTGLTQLNLMQLLEGTIGEVLASPRYFVCTNGQRDICCAKFGLKTYAALRDRAGDRVWQTTHLGGHRFSPNVLVLPEGRLYGRVTADVAADFSSSIECGKVAYGFLRGTTSYAPQAQAAEVAVGRGEVRLVRIRGNETRSVVQFENSEERYVVSVRSDTAISVLASCGDTERKEVFKYECAVLSVRDLQKL